MDLFEYLHSETCCMYISDMRFGEANCLVKQRIKDIVFEGYTLFQLSDAANYLYGYEKEFKSIEEAKAFFTKPDR